MNNFHLSTCSILNHVCRYFAISLAISRSRLRLACKFAITSLNSHLFLSRNCHKFIGFDDREAQDVRASICRWWELFGIAWTESAEDYLARMAGAECGTTFGFCNDKRVIPERNFPTVCVTSRHSFVSSVILNLQSQW